METNNLKHSISVNDKTGNYKIDIRLNDECKNGHEDFSITATFWEIGESRIDKNLISAGCCHEKILKHQPQLKLFVDLHLCDFKGTPMYAVENGYYHLYSDVAKSYLNVTDELLTELRKARHKGHFSDLITDLGIVELWQKQANKGISELERLTGSKFKSTATKSHYQPILDLTN